MVVCAKNEQKKLGCEALFGGFLIRCKPKPALIDFFLGVAVNNADLSPVELISDTEQH